MKFFFQRKARIVIALALISILALFARMSIKFSTNSIQTPTRSPERSMLIFLWLIGNGVENRYDIPRLLKNRNDYAKEHPGIDIFVQRNLTDNVSHPVWQKVYDLDTFIDRYEWFWLLDSDMLFMNFRLDVFDHVINPTLSRFENPANISIIIAEDCNGVNAGSLLVRRSEWSKEFVKLWKSKQNEEKYRSGYREQQALKDMIEANTMDLQQHVAFVPLNSINAYAQSVCGYRTPHGMWGLQLVYHAPGFGFKALVDYIDKNKLVEFH
jgi:mannan polymerase II complex MNN10 subunit